MLSITDTTSTPIPTQSFGYDERDRLSSWTSGGTTQSYAYTTIGNLTSKAGVAYTYPVSGATSVRPHTPSSVGGASYIYDANGNLTGGAGRTYTWNADNLPLSVSQTSGSASYGYDADGDRSRWCAAVRRRCLWKGCGTRCSGRRLRRCIPPSINGFSL